jgi:hypothetical protein
MSIEDFEYSIITKETKCNNCNKKKLCHRCNECFVFTCNKCIIGTIRNPRFPKCNNCNNIFVELSISNPNYGILLDNLNARLKNNYKYKNFHNIKIKEIDEIAKEIDKKLFVLSRMIIRDIRNQHNDFGKCRIICRIIKDIKHTYRSSEIINNRNYVYYEYIEININYPIIIEINNLLFEFNIYKLYKKVCNEHIYYEPNFDKLKDCLCDYVNDGKFDYLKTPQFIYFDHNNPIEKLICNLVNIEYSCTNYESKDKHKECVSNICIFDHKYYKNNIDYSQCPKCNNYRRKFENCPQIYCIKCKILYDNITKQIETHIINPTIYYVDANYTLKNKILNIQFNKFIDKLICKYKNKYSYKYIINKIKSLSRYTNFYMIFVSIIERLQD